MSDGFTNSDNGQNSSGEGGWSYISPEALSGEDRLEPNVGPGSVTITYLSPWECKCPEGAICLLKNENIESYSCKCPLGNIISPFADSCIVAPPETVAMTIGPETVAMDDDGLKHIIIVISLALLALVAVVTGTLFTGRSAFFTITLSPMLVDQSPTFF